MPSKKCILLVEDAEDIRFVFSEILSNDYEVHMASTGEEALDFLSSRKPELVILDLHIPGISGAQIYSLLRSEAAFIELPIIFVTGSAIDIEDIELDEFATILLKPFRAADLRAEISKFFP